MNSAAPNGRLGNALALGSLLCETLERALQQRFSIWANECGWQPCAGFDASFLAEASACEAIAAVLNDQQVGQTAFIAALPDSQQLLMVPIEADSHTRLLAVGNIGSHAPELARELADTVVLMLTQRVELADQSQVLEECMLQITANFEELNWLRSVGEHLELMDVRNGLIPVAQATLPALRQLVSAQAIYLFGMAESADATTERASVCPLLLCDADPAVPEELARQVIADSGIPNLRQPIVWNCGNWNQRVLDTNEIRNFILAPVTKSNEQIGWILVVNKLISQDLRQSCNLGTEDKNAFEFGTQEAGLISAMAVMLATHGRNVELLRDKESLLIGVIRALINTIDAKDAYTFGHSDRVASMSKRIAQQLGLSELECDQIHMTGLLHDIGKIGVPDSVLGKPGKLTDEEFAIIKTHPAVGVEILKDLDALSYVLPGVLHHHESLDGCGYPHGLAGEAIPLHGRIIAVADSYDAMTSNRPYRNGMPTEKAESILREGSGTQWDESVIEAFFAALKDIHKICQTGEAQETRCMETAKFGDVVVRLPGTLSTNGIGLSAPADGMSVLPIA